MFDEITANKTKSRGLKLLALASAALHVAALGALVVVGLWEIQEVGRPNRGVAMATTMPAPASNRASGAEAREPERIKPKLRIVREKTQPEHSLSKDEVSAQEGGDAGEGGGEGEGDDAGEGGAGEGSVVPGLCVDLDRCPQMPALPRALDPVGPKHLPATILSELRRVAGEADIQPPTSTRNAMSRENKFRAVALIKMCLDKRGAVTTQTLLQSSGYEDYDAKLLSAVGRWRYEPYRANGEAIAICTHATFIYQQE